MSPRALRMALLAAALLAGAGAAQALPSPPGWSAPADSRIRVQDTDIGPSGAAAAARSATGGKVLGVSAAQAGARTVYRVKVLLPGGRVRTVTVDGTTGRVSG